MKEYPKVFPDEMVRAILANKKTMARRVCKVQPTFDNPKLITCISDNKREEGKHKWAVVDESKGYPDIKESSKYFSHPYNVDDIIWVKEEFFLQWSDHLTPFYRADERDFLPVYCEWLPANFMPRWASRIDLEVTEIRVEQLQEITEEDCLREGITRQLASSMGIAVSPFQIKDTFKNFWNSTKGKKHPWESNPWVWVITFKRRFK